MALILPAVQSAREAARRTECLNHLRQLSIAMHGAASRSSSGQLPAYGVWGDDVATSAISTQPAALWSWVVGILPFIDRRDLYDRWDFNLRHSNRANATLIRTFNLLVYKRIITITILHYRRRSAAMHCILAFHVGRLEARHRPSKLLYADEFAWRRERRAELTDCR